jgi:hypothetical protein
MYSRHLFIRPRLSLLTLFTQIIGHTIAAQRNMERAAIFKGERTHALDVANKTTFATHL